MLEQVLSGAAKLNLPKYAGYAHLVSFRRRIAADGFFKTILSYIPYLGREHSPGANSNTVMLDLAPFFAISFA